MNLRIVIIFTVLSLIVACSSSAITFEEILAAFVEYKGKFSKRYNNSEHAHRLSVFQKNFEAICKHNEQFKNGSKSYHLGINIYSDLTAEEFKETVLLTHGKPLKFENQTNHTVESRGFAPAAMDWRARNYVTPIKNQQQCRSCWSFSLTGAIESAYAIRHRTSVLLSEQQLIDCTIGGRNSGCGGGWLDTTYPYIQEKGLETEVSYPYIAQTGACTYNRNRVAVRVKNHVCIHNNEYALQQAVGTIGPVSVLLDATNLQHYSGGIFDGPCEDDESHLNHAVLLVGYGQENGINYWIVKNQWSTNWGERGYFRLIRGRNRCGIANDGVYPVLY